MICPRKRDEKTHFRKYHQGRTIRELEEGEKPIKGWWWCTSQTRSTNEKWLNLGPNILLGQPCKREVIDFIKQKLREGYKVPYEFQEYGDLAVTEMYWCKEKINKIRPLKFPSDALIDEYHQIGA